MQVTLKLFAMLSDQLPAHARASNALALDVAEGASVQEVIERYRLPEKLVHLVLVNGVYVAPAERAARRLAEGDELAIWPPIAGG